MKYITIITLAMATACGPTCDIETETDPIQMGGAFQDDDWWPDSDKVVTP